MRNYPNHIRTKGTIYHDTGSKGLDASGRQRRKDCYRAEITIDGKRYRHRGADREDCEQWLKAVRSGRIKCTDNKADWWRMEQRKDEEVSIDEIITSQAEESALLYDYHTTKNIKPINDYIVKRLLPHMAYYCCHTLGFGRDKTLTASRQTMALLLTRIVSGRPVLSFTSTCKRMLRVYRERGDFWYYDQAPAEVKLMVDGLDLTPLAQVWRVTKDKRL